MNHVVTKAAAAAALLLPTLVFAHTGTHGHEGLIAGLWHPFTGVDHLLAMFAVGLWSALAVRPVWLAPLTFVTLLTVGAAGARAADRQPSAAAMDIERRAGGRICLLSRRRAWR